MNIFLNIINYLESMIELQHVLVAFIVGYICYYIASRGIRDKDKPIDFMFMLIFAMISLLLWSLFLYLEWSPFLQIIAIIAIPIMLSILWRKYFSTWVNGLLTKLGIADNEESPSILSQITDDRSLYVAQIVVYLKNGKVLICDSTYDFKKAPIESYRADGRGDIALYVTAIKDSEDAKAVIMDDPIMKRGSGDEKYRLTYVKESEISRVESVYVRLKE